MADWQIGVDAGSLVTLRNPALPTPVPTLIGAAHVSMGGSQTLDVIAKKWVTTWTWQNIPDVDYLAIKEWWDDVHGKGPFAVVDPTIDAAVHTMNITSFTPNPGPYLGLWSPEMVLTEV